MKRRLTCCVLTVAGVAAMAGVGASGATAFGWRGDGTGRYPDAVPPMSWSKGSNVVWKAKLPGTSNASTVLAGERLFVCSEPATLVCVSAADGAILWQRTNTYSEVLGPDDVRMIQEEKAKAAELRTRLATVEGQAKSLAEELKKTPENVELQQQLAALTNEVPKLKKELAKPSAYAEPATHGVNGYSSATPVTDGRHVWVVFGTGVAACYDMDGKREWARLVEKPKNGWGHSASPLLVGNTLLVHVLKMTALDAATGKTLWATASSPAWGSPVHVRIGKEDMAVTPSGDVIRVADGKKLAAKASELTYASPVVAGDMVYFVQHNGKAVRLTTGTNGAVQAEALWQTKPKDDRYYSSALLHEGLLYAITQHFQFCVIDAADGQVLYARQLPLSGTVYPSITLAGNRIFISDDAGKTLIIEPGREYKQVAENVLAPFRSTPIFVGKRMYVRTFTDLCCIGE